VQAIQSNSPVAEVAAPETDPEPELPNPGSLVRESQAGSREAYAALVGLFQDRIYNFLVRMTGQPQDAEDLAQETFVKAWQSLDRFDARFSFSTWLFTIAKRTACNHLRSRRPVADPAEAPELSDDAEDPCTVLSQVEERRELWRLARRLKPNQYQVLWLHYGEGFPVAEVAKIMGVLPIHAKVLLHRGRNQLAKLLAQQPSNVL